MINGYPISPVILAVSMFQCQLLAAEPPVQGKVPPKLIVQSELSDSQTNEWIKKLEPVTAPESKRQIEKFSLNNDSEQSTESLKNAKTQQQKPQSDSGQFIPTEAISEDLSVSFPVDI